MESMSGINPIFKVSVFVLSATSFSSVVEPQAVHSIDKIQIATNNNFFKAFIPFLYNICLCLTI